MVDLVRQVEEEMVWKGHLEDDCQHLVQATEDFERTTRKEKAERMKFAFQMASGMETMLLAGYEDMVTIRQAREQEDKARLSMDTEMRITELTVRGLKRKAFRKETAGEKVSRGQRAKRAMIDSLWQAGARKEKEKEAAEERSLKASLVQKREVQTQAKCGYLEARGQIQLAQD